MDYVTLLRGNNMFRNEWGEDRWYVNHVLGDRDIWESLDSITKEQVEDVVIEFLRKYWVQYTYRIDRDKLRRVLQGLVAYSDSLRGKRLLELNPNERVVVDNKFTTWVSQIIGGMYNELKDVRGVGDTSASKILHGINPELFILWDQFIRLGYSYPQYDASDSDYSHFMTDCQKILGRIVNDYCGKHNCGVEVAVKDICEQAYPMLEVKKPLAKLLDEYNWMKYRNGRDLPDPWRQKI